MAELKPQTSIDIDNMEANFSEPTAIFDEAKDISSQVDFMKKMGQKFKRQSCIFSTTDIKEIDINMQYQTLLNKNYVDLRNDADSSALIHILLKQEKNKLEQNFVKNAIQGLQLFENHQDLLTTQGFGNHLFTQMKVEFNEKNSIIFHYGDYGQKYYIILKGKLDLLMPKSEYMEENNNRQENGLPILPYFDESRNIPESREDEEFEQYCERVYPKLGIVKTFMPGEAFGEIALMTNQQRTGSIIAREDSYSLVITKSAFHELLGKFHEFMQIQKLDFLSQFFFLKQIPKSKLLSMIQSMKIFNFQRNNIIYNEKQLTSGIYFIREGEVQISTKINQIEQESQDESQKLKIRFRSVKKKENVIIKSTNTFFGEDEIIFNKNKRISKATCFSENCEVFLLTRDLLSTYGKQYNVQKKLKQNYDLKVQWEQERTVNIQNIQKQNEDYINNVNSNKVKEVSLSKYVIQENSAKKQRKSFTGFSNQNIASDDLIDINTHNNQPESQTIISNSKKPRILIQNSESQQHSSPKNTKSQQKIDFNSSLQQSNQSQNEKNDNFHIQNGFQNQKQIQQRKSLYLSPQPKIKNSIASNIPETQLTGHKINKKDIFRRSSLLNIDRTHDPQQNLGDNSKDKKPKLLKSPTVNLHKKHASYDAQIFAGFNQNSENNPTFQQSLANFQQSNPQQNNNIFNVQQQNQNTKMASDNSKETSVERIIFDSSHNEFESMLRKQTLLKQEILQQISKSKTLKIEGLTDLNKSKQDFKIRKQSLQYITTPKSNKHLISQIHSTSLITGFNTTKSNQRSQTNIQIEGNNFTDIENGLSAQNSQNNSERVVMVPASMAKQNIQLNFFSTKVQGNDQIQLPSLSNSNIPQTKQHTQNQLTQQITQNNSSPHLNQNTPDQKQQTLFQLDPLLEEDDEQSSPLKIGKRLNLQVSPNTERNNKEFQKNAALLSKKFQLGKKVIKYIQNRKSFNEQMVIDQDRQVQFSPSQTSYNHYDDMQSTKQHTSNSPAKDTFLSAKNHQRKGSILTSQMHQNYMQQPEKVSHHRRFQSDISQSMQKIYNKKEQQKYQNS